MQLFANVNVNFMKWKRHFVIVSTVLNVLGLAVFAWQYAGGHLNVGIDFKGGTEIQVKFARSVSVGDVRSALDNVDLRGASVTTIGDAKDNEVYIRLPLQAAETQVLLEKVKDALRGITGQQPAPPGTIDLNVADEKTVGDFLVEAGKFSPDESKVAAAAISAYKKGRGGIIGSADDLKTLTGVNPQVLSWLSGKSTLAAFSIRSQNSVEGAISRELARKAFYAVIGSMAIMLIYIWIRFRFQWGLGAIVATIHDVIVTLLIFCVVGKEWSIPVIAAFLTLTGYSTNDTIVVFDRIRENMQEEGGVRQARGSDQREHQPDPVPDHHHVGADLARGRGPVPLRGRGAQRLRVRHDGRDHRGNLLLDLRRPADHHLLGQDVREEARAGKGARPRVTRAPRAL